MRAIRDAVELRVQDLVENRLSDAPVRSFVMTFAHRRTRECLAADRCDPLLSV